MARPVITAAEPQLLVADVRASCDFFSQKLGFKIAFVYGDPPFFGQVVRDGARLNLRCVGTPMIDMALRDREELLSATMSVQFHQSLKLQPWGARNFIVKDLDGNLLLFAGPAD